MAVVLSRQQVITAGLTSLLLTVGLARFSYTPLLPLMKDQAGLTAFWGGWLATVNYMGYISGAILASLISRIELKFTFYRICLVTAVLTTAGMGLTENTAAWVLLRYASGVSSVGGMLLASGLIMNWLARNGYKTELGLHFMGLGGGLALSGIVFVVLMPWVDWSGQWLSMGLLSAALLVPAWAWMPRPAPHVSASAQSHGVDTVPEGPGGQWLRLMVAAYCCAGVGYVLSATFIVAILEQIPAFRGQGAWVWVLVGAASMPSTFLWDRVARRLGGLQALMCATVLQIASIAIAAFSDHYVLGLVGAALWGGTFAGIVSLTLSITGRYYPSNPAKAMARMTISYGAAQIIAPAIAGIMAAQTGSYRPSLTLAVLVMMVGLGLLARLSQINTTISSEPAKQG